MGSAKIMFNTGVAQGSVLSPLLFSLFINALSLYLTDIGRKKRIHHGLPGTNPFNHILFTDDMTLLAQDREGMQTLLNAIQEFEEWSGIPVNTLRTKQMTVNGIEDNRAIIEELTYHDKPLPIDPESESVRYLVFWANIQSVKDLVFDRTRRAKKSIQGHWLCTSKEELTGEVEARSRDETIDNVWLRMAMCDHLFEFKTWRQDDPKPLRGIYEASTRHIN
jgi:hypothetical protein